MLKHYSKANALCLKGLQSPNKRLRRQSNDSITATRITMYFINGGINQ